MKCKSCGKEVKKDSTFCSECGTKLKEDNMKVEKLPDEKRIINSMSNGTFFCLLSLLSLFLSFFVRFAKIAYLSRCYLLFSLTALVLCIYARVKYPRSTFAKVLLVIYIIFIVLIIAFIIFIIVACKNLLSGCRNIGLLFYCF